MIYFLSSSLCDQQYVTNIILKRFLPLHHSFILLCCFKVIIKYHSIFSPCLLNLCYSDWNSVFFLANSINELKTLSGKLLNINVLFTFICLHEICLILLKCQNMLPYDMLPIENAMQIINLFSFVNRFSVLHMLTGCDNTLIIFGLSHR